MRSLLISRLISLFALTAVLGAEAGAETPWFVEYNQQQNRVTAEYKDKRYSLIAPRSVSKIAADDNTLFLWQGEKKELTLISKYELSMPADGTLSIVPYGNISFTEELGRVVVLDFTALQNGGASQVMFSAPGSKPGRITVYPFAFLKKREVDEAALEKPEGPQRPAQRDDRTRTGLISFKGSGREILGTGSIALLKDPETGGVVLLSYDSASSLIHEYGATNPYEPIYLRSHSIPEGLRASMERAPLNEFALDSIGAPPAQFYLRHPGYEPLRLSLLRLREVSAIQRTFFLNNWANEVAGNVWTKQLLGWGALSSTVDYLDRFYSNPNVDISALGEDAGVRAILGQINQEQVLKWAEESGLFTAKEIGAMKLEATVQRSKGRKAFLTANLILGLLAYVNFKDSVVLRNQITHMTSNIWAFAENALRAIGRSPEQLQNFRRWGVRMQIRFRSHLVESAREQRHPLHLIRSIEKNLAKARTKLAAEDAAFAVKIEPAKTADARVRQIMDQWKALLEGAPAERAKQMQKMFTAIESDVKKLQTLEEQIKVGDRVTAIKTQILLAKGEAAALEKGLAAPNIREIVKQEENMVFLKATDADFIRQNAKEAKAALDNIETTYNTMARMKPADKVLADRASYFSRVLKPQRVAKITEGLEKLLAEQSRLNAIVEGWTAQGKVHPFFDYWARCTSMWAQYFLPQAGRKAVGLESDFAKRYVRQDYIRTAEGKLEQVKITGEHTRLSLYGGLADVVGDTISQWIARSGAYDPSERMWGNTDNHFGLVPFEDGMYGPHFDLLASEMVNAWTWLTSMPLSYAYIDMNYSSKGSISYLRRLVEAQKRQIPNTPWAMMNEYPFWYASSKLIAWDYERSHKETGTFSETAFKRFKEQLDNRTTSASSQLERVLFYEFVGVPYMKPQYTMQGEFNKVSDLIFRTPLVKQAVGGIILPVTTGYGYGKWWGDYFGFNHPATIELMKRLDMDGILKKIDSDGYTNLNEWTEHELTMFFFLISLLEMERYQKEKPVPVGGTPEELAAWYGEIYKNLFAGEGPSMNRVQNSLGRLRVIQPAAMGKDSITRSTRWGAQAETMLSLFRKMEAGISRLPFTAPNARSKDSFAVQVTNTPAAAQPAVAQLQSHLQEAIHINAALSDTLRVMQANKGTMLKMQANSWALNLANTIVLGDQFFSRGKLLGLPGDLIGKWNATSQRILNRLALGGVVATVPFFLWLDDQAEAHLRQATNNGVLLRDLQSLLFAATEVITAQYVNASLAGEDLRSLQGNFSELRTVMEQNKRELESFLKDTQAESEELLTARRYRWAKVYSEYSLFGMGGMAAWIAARYTLFRASQGLILKMTDPFAPFLFKASALAWLYFGHEYRSQQQRIALTTQDFFVLYQSYVSTLLRIELLKRAEAAAQAKQPLPADLGAQLQEAMGNQAVVRQMEAYRQQLLKLTTE